MKENWTTKAEKNLSDLCAMVGCDLVRVEDPTAIGLFPPRPDRGRKEFIFASEISEVHLPDGVLRVPEKTLVDALDAFRSRASRTDHRPDDLESA